MTDIPDQIGRYRVGHSLGQGGFALVVKARDEGLDADVAIKILDAQQAFDPDLRERFVREARLLRRVQNPHVVSVFDIGELDDGRPYFVMEFASGGVVRERFTGAAPSPGDLQSVVIATRSGLGALHRAGIVHRDIKPDNLLITGGEEAAATQVGVDRLDAHERVVIGDLGLAKDQLVTGAGPTILGGTPRFRAPEQLDDRGSITPATDTYAASGVLWQLLTDSLPPEDLESEITDIDPSWAAFFRQGLARHPDDRYATVEQWAEAAMAIVDRAEASAAGATGYTATAVATGVCPYKGLAAYQPEDAALFFGREALVDELISRLQMGSILVVAGPSGSGKSSVVRAGLLPAVERGALPGSHEWTLALMTPGTRPLVELDRQIDRLTTEPTAGLDRRGALLLIDQFEEIFTAAPDDAGAFVARLEELTRPERRVRLVLVLRADFYDRCAVHPWLAQAINDNQVLVGPMQRADLRRAIEAPARRAGLRFEPGLVDRVLDDAGHDAGSLPLVAHALMETWLRRKGNELTVAGYEASGGVAGAIAQSAEAAHGDLDDEASAASRALFLRLVNAGDGNAVTRRRLALDDLEADERAIVEQWADARLLTVDDQHVDITHEAMLDTWPRLRQWIAEGRDDLRTRQRIGQAAEAWLAADRDPALLYRGTPLEATLAWEADHTEALSAAEHEFIAASARQRDAEQEAAATIERRQQQRRRRAIAALAVLASAAVVASLFAFIALDRSRTAENEANESQRELIARQDTDGDPRLATALAAETIARSDPPSAEALARLVESRIGVAEAGPLPLGSPIEVREGFQVAMAADGSRFAVGTRKGTVELGATDRPEERTELRAHESGIEGMAFRPDGDQLASVSNDGSVVLWDLTATPPFPNQVLDIDNFVWDVAYTSAGDIVGASTEPGRVHLFDADTGLSIRVIDAGEPNDLLSIAFTPDGSTVFAGTGDGLVFGWDVATGDPVLGDGLQAHGSDVWELVVSGDGRYMASVGSDGRLRLWDLAGDEPPGPDDAMEPLQSDDERMVSEAAGAVWVPGDTIYVGEVDGSLWRVDGILDDTPVAQLAYRGLHEDKIVDTAASGDGTMLITISEDEIIRLLDDDQRRPIPDPIATIPDPGVHSIGLSPADTTVAVGSSTGELNLIDVASDAASRHTIGSARLSAVDHLGEVVVVGDTDGRLVVVDAEDGTVLASVSAHADEISRLSVDPGGDTVVTVGFDGFVRAWDVSDLAETAEVAIPDDVPTAVTHVGADEVVVGTRRGNLHRWSIGDDTVSDPVAIDRDTIWDLDHDPDSGLLAAALAARLLVVVDADDLSGDRTEVIGFEGGATGVSFIGPRGDVVAVVTRQGRLRLVHAPTGQVIGPFITVHDGATFSVIGTRTRSLVYTVGADGVVNLVDVLDVETACTVSSGALDAANLATYVPDGSMAACGT